jgi:hypothetical protein
MVYATTIWVASVSDKRINEEINDLDGDIALQKVLSIQPKSL